MQDGTPVHANNNIIDLLNNKFCDWVIMLSWENLWLTCKQFRSKPLNFYFWKFEAVKVWQEQLDLLKQVI